MNPMRIISDFHDYYDSVQKYQDDHESCVFFNRKQQEYSIDRVKDFQKSNLIYKIYERFYGFVTKAGLFDLDRAGISLLDKNTKKNYSKLSIHKSFVCFCGKGYRGLEVTKSGYEGTNFLCHVYSAEDLEKIMDQNEVVYKDKKSQQNAVNYFKPVELDQDFLIENKITSFVINDSQLVINPRLKRWEFQKVLDPFSAYQELDMWMSGVLSYPQNIMIEVSNESKIEKGGFDRKISFRHRK
jgi:hypothetical protein